MLRPFAALAVAATLAACSGAPAEAPAAPAPPEPEAAPQADPPAADPDGIFPYRVAVRDLDNGLRTVVVPTGLPDIVSLQLVLGTGSRDEVEPGKSGFAHFFEHMMFRGTEARSAEAYKGALKRMGGDQNAYTSNDRTVYHTTLLAEDLDEMLAMEADRFQNLAYSEADFRTEAQAVLGEYNKNVANPVSKLFEVQRAAAFRRHTYRHTTMGFLEDIQAMPEGFDYSRSFFDRFYRPENTVVLIAGDVEPEAAFAMVERHFGGWERGYTAPEIPAEPALGGPVYDHVDWDGPTPAWLTVAFRGPGAYPTATNAAAGDMQALDVVSSLAFGPSSPLYQRLVVEEQVADAFGASFPDSRDPYLLTLYARVPDSSRVAYVRDQIQQELARLRVQPPDAGKLADLKSALKYGFAAGLDNSEAIADALVPALSVSRDPQTLNAIYANYDAVTPADVRDAARRYFRDEGMVVVTLAQHGLPPEAMRTGSVDARVPGVSDAGVPDAGGEAAPTAAEPAVQEIALEMPPASDGSDIAVLRQDSPSPLVSLRVVVEAGAAADPEGKEGLAALTASMVADASSERMSYAEIQSALFPLAAGLGAQVGKERTTFSGTVHRDNLDRYWGVVGPMLAAPAFTEEDFARLQAQQVAAIRTGLRAGNDEELGKEVLYEAIYAGHPYGHLSMGHAEAVEALTLDDVRAFYRDHYTRDRLTVGVAGGIGDAGLARIRRTLGSRPATGAPSAAMLPRPAEQSGPRAEIVAKPEARATAISMGFPIAVTRAHPDFVALDLVRSWLGEHRNSSAHLFRRIREVRGMNYGDYAYVEYYPGGMFTTMPPAGLARQQQIFQVWIRPVPPEQAHFAIRVAQFELDRLVRDGLTEAQFEASRAFLTKYAALLTSTQGRRLGYTLDQQAYGHDEEFVAWYRERLAALTLADVNRAIREHLDAPMTIVAIAPDAERLAAALVSGETSPISYPAEKPAELLAEDAVVQDYPLGLDAESVSVTPVGDVFERPVFE